MKAVDVLLEVLADEGVQHVFGNPGTTELPFVGALGSHPELHYVLALQEATAVGAADGYAQATGRAAFANLHTAAGLGNAIGNLTNARVNGAPLVVTAGNADRRHLVAEPMLSGDLVGLAAGVSKWGHEVRHAGELGTVLRRAFLDACRAPAGPVFVSIPSDVLDEDVDQGAPARTPLAGPGVAAGLDQLVDRLVAAETGRVAIVAGDEVAAGDALVELEAVAELLGAPVFGSPLHARRCFPSTHPLWRGMLHPQAAAIRAQLEPFDVVFLVGGQAFMVYPYAPGSPLPDGVALFHLSPDPMQPGRTHPATLGLTGALQPTLSALAQALRGRADLRDATAAVAAAHRELEETVARFEETAQARYDDVPIDPMAAAHALVHALPPESVVVDEAITTGVYVRGFHRSAGRNTYWFCRGGGLGWGMPASLGVSLGLGREPVLCVVGDGSAMYSPQALWTAAREALPVVFAVVDNAQYLILKQNLRARGATSFVGMDLDRPPLDFVALARSMGVPATRVDKAADAGDAVRAAWGNGPHLVHVPIAAR